MRLDILQCGGHPLPSLHAAADEADGHVGALLHEPARRLRGDVAHPADQWTTAARLDAKELPSSKAQVENHTLQSRGAQGGERTMG